MLAVIANTTIELAPETRLKVVQSKAPAKRKSKSPTSSLLECPFGPATAMIDKSGRIYWQLQIDFEHPIKSIEALPGGLLRIRDRMMSELGEVANINGRTMLRYEYFMLVCKAEIRRATAKTHTMRGLEQYQIDDLAIDFLHDNIEHVSTLIEKRLEAPAKKRKALDDDGTENLMGYLFSHIKPNARRFIKNLDQRRMDHQPIDDPEYDADDNPLVRRSDTGNFGLLVSNEITPMEGSIESFQDFCYNYIFDWVEREYAGSDPSKHLNAHFFKLYYGTSGKVTQGTICEQTGFTRKEVKTGYETVMSLVKKSITKDLLMSEFNKYLNGCHCD